MINYTSLIIKSQWIQKQKHNEKRLESPEEKKIEWKLKWRGGEGKRSVTRNWKSKRKRLYIFLTLQFLSDNYNYTSLAGSENESSPHASFKSSLVLSA